MSHTFKKLFILALTVSFVFPFVSPVKEIFSSSHKPMAEQAAKENEQNKASFEATFRDVTLQSIFCHAKRNNIEFLDFDKVRKFIVELCDKGYAEIKGSDKLCRFVYGTTQGALEDALSKLLAFGEIKSVKTIILTPLPTTPLRKKGDTKNISKIPFDRGRQHAIDMREYTLRSLRNAGALIISVYSKPSFDEWKNENKEGVSDQLKIWLLEKKHKRVIDMPINTIIPKKMVGALYLITDKKGNQYYLPTLGIQPCDAGAEARWEMWLAEEGSSSKCDERAKSMLEFIKEHSSHDLDF